MKFDSDVLLEIRTLEVDQARALRELSVNPAGLAPRQRLLALDGRINELRQSLSAFAGSQDRRTELVGEQAGQAGDRLRVLRQREQANIKAHIAAIEAAQPRALREAALASEGTPEALRAFARLAEIDAQISDLRQRLAAIDAAADEAALIALKSREASL